MKKIVVFIFVLFVVSACQKETEEIVITSSDIRMVIPNLPENPAPGQMPEITAATFKLKTFDYSMLKNGEITPESTLEPAEVWKNLKAGHSFTESKTANIQPAPPMGDVLFMFDLTGSMYGAIENAKINSENIMGAVNGLIADSKFGVVSHKDYEGYFSSCGYSDWYGGDGDFPYMLNQSVTTETTDVTNAINSLDVWGGADGPESYTRVLYETMNDPGIGWRPEAKKIVVAFLDNIPHDCMFETGGDPGRNAIAGDEDDLDFKEVLYAMKEQNITLIVVDCGGYVTDFWNTYAGLTGGAAYPLGADIDETIAEIIEAEISQVDNLSLEVCTPGFESWMTSLTPEEYTDVELPGAFAYEVTYTVPEGTLPGEYTFDVCAIGDGVSYASQTVNITVYKEIPFDVYPITCPNALNRESKGWTPMALLGTADFDVSQVNIETLTINGILPVKWSFDDVGTPQMPFVDKPLNANECNMLLSDGLMDLTLKFKTEEFGPLFNGAAVGDVVVATITGELLDGTKFIGEDVILIVK